MKKDLSEDPLARARRRAVQYQHVDGTYELSFGVAFLLMAACFFVISRMAVTNDLLAFAPLAVFAGGAYLMDALVTRFRMRVTFPRTGYIDYQKPKPLKRSTRLVIWIGTPLLIVILLAMVVLNRPTFQSGGADYGSILAPSLFGLLFAGLWAIAAWKIALPRFLITAAVSLLAGAWLFFNGVGGNSAMAGLFGAMGADLCISGGLTLRKYLRENPVPQETADEQ